MTPYSDAELEAMMVDLESDLVERKKSLKGDAPTKIREAVCAFANDLPDHRRPGVVFVGVRDDGSPSGLAITDELLRTLADVKTDGNIVPPPTVTVANHHLRGAEVAVLTVRPADSPPVRFKGRVWVRVGPRRAIATAQDESILSERRRHRDRPFDAQPVSSAVVSDLSQATFENEYLPSAVARDVLDRNDRSFEQRLAATKMIVAADEPTPTVLGVLVLSPRTRDFLPGAYVQFLRVQGTKLDDPITDEGLIDGVLSDVLRRIDEKLEAHIRTTVDISSASVEQRRRTYPKGALQQLVRNAVMHRTYEATNAPVRVTWYDDRIEIVSPGGPFGTVRADNFGDPGVADYRNPNLAEAMRVLGFVQRYGVGIAIARRLLEENGNPPPEFDVQPTLVGVTVRTAR
ncbi:MAG: putative DNA binding domain-containing protein [Planctomycetes bacterium]|nr:putative DNA binding domain-containing protein [Planctomycetota bacterium]